MTEVYANDFDMIVNKAKGIGKPARVVIAGADCENMLLGAFDAQKEGFVEPILVGNKTRITEMLERLGLADQKYSLQAVSDDVNVVQFAIDMIHAGEADILMRGNTQTRDFLMTVLNKGNRLLTPGKLMTHVNMLKMPDYPKIMAISDVTIIVQPSIEQRKEIIKNMVDVLKMIGVTNPNIALLSLVEKPSFHMRDTVEAQTIVMHQADEPFAECNLVGPIPYDLIVSKEAARLKNYDCPYCGEFDGIVAPNLISGNLMIKILETNCRANSFGVIMGAKIPIALTSRSDSKEQAYLSLAACAVMNEDLKNK